MSTPTHRQRIRSALNRCAAEEGNGTAAGLAVEEAIALTSAEYVSRLSPDALPIPPLMGATEAAEVLGVSTSNLGKVTGLVEVQRLTRGALYRASDVQRIAAERAARRAEASA